jgi:hypothetical protein
MVRKKKVKASTSTDDYGLQQSTAGIAGEILVENVVLGTDTESYHTAVLAEDRLHWNRSRRHKRKLVPGGIKQGRDEDLDSDEDGSDIDDFENGYGAQCNVTPEHLLQEFFGKGLLHHHTFPLRRPAHRLAVFISSAATDTLKEREVLSERILPFLQNKVQGAGVEVMFVDMHHGMKEEPCGDINSWVASQRELERCHRESGGACFLSLQSAKYGPALLPPELDEDTFEACIASAKGNLPAMAKSLYSIDTNASPAMYILKRPEALGDKGYADLKNKLLKDVFSGHRCTGVSHHHHHHLYHHHIQQLNQKQQLQQQQKKQEPEQVAGSSSSVATGAAASASSSTLGADGGGGFVIGRSMCEWEIKSGLCTQERISRSYWVHRIFFGGVKDTHYDFWRYDDTIENKATTGNSNYDEKAGFKLRQLKSFLTEQLRREEERNHDKRILMYRDMDIGSYLDGANNGRYVFCYTIALPSFLVCDVSYPSIAPCLHSLHDMTSNHHPPPSLNQSINRHTTHILVTLQVQPIHHPVGGGYPGGVR